jgi:hypothetical protein
MQDVRRSGRSRESSSVALMADTPLEILFVYQQEFASVNPFLLSHSCGAPSVRSRDHNDVDTFRLGPLMQLSVKAVDINRAEQEN